MTMQLDWKIKRFDELSAAELYQVLRLRSEVFVVEQKCVYQDVDGKDNNAIHLIGNDGDEVVAYARLFGPDDYFDTPSIGRVVVAMKYRERKWGHALMRVAIDAVRSNFNDTAITISAQSYLKKFYMQHGFIQIGNEYLEDGIPHIR